MISRLNSYVKGVESGDIITNKWVKLAVKRYLFDLTRDDIYFCKKSASRFIGFLESLSHFEGELAGQYIRLEPWQVFIFAQIYGWKWKDTGTRRFVHVYIEVPRKNGKTLVGAGAASYALCADSEGGAQVYCTATKKDQAMAAFRGARTFIEEQKSEAFKDGFKITLNPARIEYARAKSFMKPLSKDAGGKSTDGLNPHFILLDELHAWVDEGYYNVLISALGARVQPMMFGITTAGHSLTSIGRKHNNIVKSVLENHEEQQNDNYFGIIYSIDEGDDIESEESWKKANPNYGVSVRPRFMREQLELAKADPSIMREFKVKHLNIWMNQKSLWLDSSSWEACYDEEIDKEGLKGLRCYGGIDLAIVNDLSAFVLYFPEQDGLEKSCVLSFFWCCEEDIETRSRKDKVPYQSWADKGHIIVTSGNTTDHDKIAADIVDICQLYDVQAINYDRNYSEHVVRRLHDDEGLPMYSFAQTITHFSLPSQELERLVISGELNHFNHPILTWNAGNTIIYSDANGNIRPDKQKSEEKIDGIVAFIMALAFSIEAENSEDDDYSAFIM